VPSPLPCGYKYVHTAVIPYVCVRCAVCGVRCAVCGVRCAVCGVWCAVCGVRCGGHLVFKQRDVSKVLVQPQVVVVADDAVLQAVRNAVSTCVCMRDVCVRCECCVCCVLRLMCVLYECCVCVCDNRSNIEHTARSL
jgi:hypothetical protein